MGSVHGLARAAFTVVGRRQQQRAVGGKGGERGKVQRGSTGARRPTAARARAGAIFHPPPSVASATPPPPSRGRSSPPTGATLAAAGAHVDHPPHGDSQTTDSGRRAVCPLLPPHPAPRGLPAGSGLTRGRRKRRRARRGRDKGGGRSPRQGAPPPPSDPPSPTHIAQRCQSNTAAVAAATVPPPRGCRRPSLPVLPAPCHNGRLSAPPSRRLSVMATATATAGQHAGTRPPLPPRGGGGVALHFADRGHARERPPPRGQRRCPRAPRRRTTADGKEEGKHPTPPSLPPPPLLPVAPNAQVHAGSRQKAEQP